jgi:hypothetical protein
MKEVDDGIKFVAAELLQGRPGLHLGLGPSGYALIVGNRDRGILQTDHGAIIAVSLSRSSLSALERRAQELLRLPALRADSIIITG